MTVCAHPPLVSTARLLLLAATLGACQGAICPDPWVFNDDRTRCLLLEDDNPSEGANSLARQTVVLRSPWNGFYTGSFRAPDEDLRVPHPLRPRLRWVPVDGATRYDLELTKECSPADRHDCSFSDAIRIETAAAEAEHTLQAPLDVNKQSPVGDRWLWRVRGCNDAHCTPWSEVRYLNIGRLDHDYNGDGFGDMLISAPGAVRGGSAWGVVWAFFGGSAIPTQSSHVMTPPELPSGRSQANRLASLGDVNGDGFSDGVASNYLAQNFEALGAGTFWTWLGTSDPSAFGSEAHHNTSRTGTTAWANLGNSIVGGFDLDGNGYDDIVVSVPGSGNGALNEGQLHIYYGGSGGLMDSADVTIDNPTNSENAFLGGGTLFDERSGTVFGTIQGLAHGGDVDGDGYPDVIARALSHPHEDGPGKGQLLVLFGEPGGLLNERPVQYVDDPRNNATAIGTPHAAGDADDDGFSDVLLADHFASRSQVFLLHGGVGGLTDRISEVSRPEEVPEGTFSFGGGKLDNWFGPEQHGIYVASPVHSLRDGTMSRVTVRQVSNADLDGENLFPFGHYPEDTLDTQVVPYFASTTAHADLNGDGVSELLVGLFRPPALPLSVGDNSSEGGAVFVYQRRGNETQTHFIPRPELPSPFAEPEAGSWFGFAIAGAAYR